MQVRVLSGFLSVGPSSNRSGVVLYSYLPSVYLPIGTIICITFNLCAFPLPRIGSIFHSPFPCSRPRTRLWDLTSLIKGLRELPASRLFVLPGGCSISYFLRSCLCRRLFLHKSAILMIGSSALSRLVFLDINSWVVSSLVSKCLPVGPRGSSFPKRSKPAPSSPYGYAVLNYCMFLFLFLYVFLSQPPFCLLCFKGTFLKRCTLLLSS